MRNEQQTITEASDAVERLAIQAALAADQILVAETADEPPAVVGFIWLVVSRRQPVGVNYPNRDTDMLWIRCPPWVAGVLVQHAHLLTMILFCLCRVALTQQLVGGGFPPKRRHRRAAVRCRGRLCAGTRDRRRVFGRVDVQPALGCVSHTHWV